MKNTIWLRFTGLLMLASLPVSVTAEPYPLEYFALREVVSNVEVSPDGKRVAMLKILSRGGNPVLYVHDTNDLDADPLVVDADAMEIRSYGWVSDRNMVVIFRQKVRDKIDGQNQGVYETKIALLNIDSKQFDEFNVGYPSVENILPNDTNRIIISTIPGTEEKLSISSAFRPRAYYKLNLKNGAKQLLIHGKLDLGQIEFDADGDPWLARGFDQGRQEYVWYYRTKGGKGWDEVFRLHEDSFESFQIHGKDEDVPGNVIVSYQNGHDKIGLWSYNTRTKTFDELLYRRDDMDVSGVRFHSNNWTFPDKITAVSYRKGKPRFEYFDQVEGATYAQLEDLIPHAHYVRITSRSRDGNIFTIANSGPRDPGTYYLYRNGEFETLGSQQPLIDSDELADMKYISYTSRDGRKIPAYVTIPKGKKPFPLVVLPHGGPFVQETVIYDEWVQMLANNGYMVLQPQYRGSKGYGQGRWRPVPSRERLCRS
jgi:dipeptidyl aminopeptidase/acylaminoacyl peptidase